MHDDIQPCQWLKTKDGVLKLGDFNRAEIMDWNDQKKEYCSYNNGAGYGNVSTNLILKFFCSSGYCSLVSLGTVPSS